MAGEALPWLLMRTLNTLNEHDKSLHIHYQIAHVAFVSFPQLFAFLRKVKTPSSCSLQAEGVDGSTTTPDLPGTSSNSSSLGSSTLDAFEQGIFA